MGGLGPHLREEVVKKNELQKLQIGPSKSLGLSLPQSCQLKYLQATRASHTGFPTARKLGGSL